MDGFISERVGGGALKWDFTVLNKVIEQYVFYYCIVKSSDAILFCDFPELKEACVLVLQFSTKVCFYTVY